MKFSLLKSLLAAATIAVGFTAIPSTAEAGGPHRFSHKCGKCGGSVYKKRVVIRRDNCGRPVHRWVRLSHRCAPVRPVSHASHHGHGHGCSSHHSQKIHPAEVIIPILNFIASQQQRKQSYGPPPSTISSTPYGATPYGSGKSYEPATPYRSDRPVREYRY